MAKKYPLNYQPKTRASNYKAEDFHGVEFQQMIKAYGFTEEEGIAILDEYATIFEEMVASGEERGLMIPGLGIFYHYKHKKHLKFKNTKDT